MRRRCVGIFEEHSEVVAEWQRRGLRHRTLIYLDAHLDLKWIGQERIDALRRCTSWTEVAGLAKPHHLLSASAGSYSIEDFLFAAHRLGLFNRLVWVRPPHLHREHGSPASLQYLEGIDRHDLETFRQEGNVVRGCLLGVPLEMCELRDLHDLEIPSDSLVDVDIDYFLADREPGLWIDPREVFQVLESRVPKADCMTLTRSVTSGFMPLSYRFLADYLAALWNRDQRLSDHYGRLLQYDRVAQQGDWESAAQGYETELRQFPDCAATHYLQSMTVVDPLRSAASGHQAAELDPAFAPSVLRSACEILSRRLAFDEQTLRSLEHQLPTEPQCQDSISALSHCALACLHARLGHLADLCDHYRSYRRLADRRHPLLDFELGRLLYQRGRRQFAMAFLQSAVNDEQTSSRAHAILANLHLQAGAWDQAAASFLALAQRFPCWSKPRDALVRIARHLQDPGLQLAVQSYFRKNSIATNPEMAAIPKA